jgi:hypothetical protein
VTFWDSTSEVDGLRCENLGKLCRVDQGKEKDSHRFLDRLRAGKIDVEGYILLFGFVDSQLWVGVSNYCTVVTEACRAHDIKWYWFVSQQVEMLL